MPYSCIREQHRKLLLPQGVHTLGAEGIVFGLKLCAGNCTCINRNLLLEQCSSTPPITASWQLNEGTSFLSIGTTTPKSLRCNELTCVFPGTAFYCPNKISTKLCNRKSWHSLYFEHCKQHYTRHETCITPSANPCPRGYDLQPSTP